MHYIDTNVITYLEYFYNKKTKRVHKGTSSEWWHNGDINYITYLGYFASFWFFYTCTLNISNIYLLIKKHTFRFIEENREIGGNLKRNIAFSNILRSQYAPFILAYVFLYVYYISAILYNLVMNNQTIHRGTLYEQRKPQNDILRK